VLNANGEFVAINFDRQRQGLMNGAIIRTLLSIQPACDV